MDLLCVGDNIVDCYVDSGVMCPGGNCVNVAVHAARAGLSSAYVGVVGDDARGSWLLGQVAAEGVDVSAVRRRPGLTGYAEIHRTAGERHFGAFDRGVARFRPDTDWLNIWPAARIVHTSYSSGLEDHLDRLSDLGAVAFDFDVHTGDDYARALMPHVTHAFFSGGALTEDAAEEVAHWAAGLGATTCTVTRGGAGAIHLREDAVHHVIAEPVDVVDTLGAGDAFIAGVLAGMLTDAPPAAYLAAAAHHAAEVCTSPGGFGRPAPLTGSADLPNTHETSPDTAQQRQRSPL